MKNIAVIIHSLTVEYSIEVLHGIADFFTDKDVRLIIAQTKNPHSQVGIFEYHCWSAAEILASETIDAIIIVSGSFSGAVENEQLTKLFQIYADKPVISIAAQLDLPNCVYTKVDSRAAYKDTIKHLKEVHGCKKIGFFSGNPTKAAECLERYEAYKLALLDNQLEFDESLVLDGYLVSSSAEQIILETYKSRTEIPFDAILCVNDLTAIGCMKALQKLKVKIPEDVKVIGFDETSHSSTSVPRLSTINPDIYMQGRKGAELAYQKLMHVHVRQENLLYAQPLYRQSCGCISCSNFDDIYKNQDLKICHKTMNQLTHSRSTGRYFNFLHKIDDIYTCFDMVQSATTKRKLFYNMPYLMQTASISSLAIYISDEPQIIEREDDIKLPEKLSVEMYVDNLKEIRLFQPGISFNPSTTLFPGPLFNGHSGNYLVQPIFSGTKNYGFILCFLKDNTFSLYNLFLRIVNNAITQAYEYTSSVFKNQKLENQNTKLILDNSDLSLQSKTDELTKIFNRRGFYEFGQKALDVTIEMGGSGLVFFADMDNLKYINDTFGHKIGDVAIKAQATVLTQALRANDVVGRLSGDEFAIVASGMNMKQVDKIRNKVKELSKVISEEKGFEFELSCSFGAAVFDFNHNDLLEILKEADNDMYKEKHEKHKLRKQNG